MKGKELYRRGFLSIEEEQGIIPSTICLSPVIYLPTHVSDYQWPVRFCLPQQDIFLFLF